MALQLYTNQELETTITDLTNTKLTVNGLMTMDYSLTVSAGLQKTINKYTYSGTVEKLAKGAKNSVIGEVSLVPTTYNIERYQQTFKYNDMDVMQDPFIMDVLTDGASKKMANHIKSQYFTELDKISNVVEYNTVFSYDTVVDALQEIGIEAEENSFIILGSDLVASIRKDANFITSRQGEILYTGQFGSIAGVPVITSKLVPSETAYITKKEAVKFFVKKEGSVEQDRDVEAKDNTVVYDRYGLIALVDDTESIKIVKQQP